MSTTTGEKNKYLDMIQLNFERIKELRQRLEVAKCQAAADDSITQSIARMEEVIKSNQISFDEYDDVVVRRLIECIRVMKDRKIVVVLKGGLQAEEYVGQNFASCL
ncbi:MAG: hypothetical protein IJU56_04135 [Clostridia bacterium]|nr:hypothetical protein [Clostridia bacterium]